MRQLLIFFFFITVFWSCDVFKNNYNPEIDAAELSTYIHYLASEELKGRAPGTDGDKTAAEFIKQQFQDAGLKMLGQDGYQYFEVTTGISYGEENTLSSGDSVFMIGESYVPISFSGNGDVSAEVVFAGYGFSIKSDSLNWDDYAEIDAEGKWALILRADPDLDNLASPFAQFSTDRYKVMNALDHGAIGVVLVNTNDYDSDDNLEKLKAQRGISAAKIPVIQVKRRIAELLIHENGKNLVDLESYYKTQSAPFSFATSSVSFIRLSVISIPNKPPLIPITVPCSSKFEAHAPSLSNSMTAFLSGSFKIFRQVLAIRQEAAVCELDGPRITGPITSLKIPGSFFIESIILIFLFHFLKRSISGSSKNQSHCPA